MRRLSELNALSPSPSDLDEPVRARLFPAKDEFSKMKFGANSSGADRLEPMPLVGSGHNVALWGIVVAELLPAEVGAILKA